MPAEERVVQVRHDEVGVVHLPVERRDAPPSRPVSPPAVKIASAPAIHSIGRFIFTRPTISVATKAKSWMPVGITTASDAAEKKPRRSTAGRW